jgi:hypothetical protein
MSPSQASGKGHEKTSMGLKLEFRTFSASNNVVPLSHHPWELKPYQRKMNFASM